MKKTLHIIVRCFESNLSSMIYTREEITVIKSVQSLPIQTAEVSVLHWYFLLPLVSPRLTSESIVLINSIPSILSFQIAQGVLLYLSCWRNLYYLPNKITVQLQGICFHLKRIALQLSNLCILQFYVPVSSSLSICRVKNMLDKW